MEGRALKLLAGIASLAIVGLALVLIETRSDGTSVQADALQRVTAVGLDQRWDLRVLGLGQAVQVSTLAEADPASGVLVFDQDSLAEASAEPHAFDQWILEGKGIVALNVPMNDLLSMIDYAELRARLGLPEKKPYPTQSPDEDFYSYVILGYESGAGTQYSNGGQKTLDTFSRDMERLSNLQAEYNQLRNEQKATDQKVSGQR